MPAAALTGAGDLFPTVVHKIMADRVLKTARRSGLQLTSADADIIPLPDQNGRESGMDHPVAIGPSGRSEGATRRDDQGIGPVSRVIHRPPTRPPSDPRQFRKPRPGFQVTTKVADTAPSRLPAVDAQKRFRRSLQQPFVHRHVPGAVAFYLIMPQVEKIEYNGHPSAAKPFPEREKRKFPNPNFPNPVLGL